MAKVKRVRTKACSRCDETNDVLYRVKVDSNGDGSFVWPNVIHVEIDEGGDVRSWAELE